MGALIAFLALIVSVVDGIFQVAEGMPLTLKAFEAAERVGRLLDAPAISAPDEQHGDPAPPLRRGLSLEDVSFGYTPGRLAVERLSLEMPERGRVALVGPSGSGKSTVLRLLLGFSAPEAGAVRWAGRDIRELSPASLRDRIAVVFQDTALFQLSVRENIRLGRLDATDDEVVAAARAAGIHDVIESMPAGYDTPIAVDGGNLSGGQRQRISLARALVRSPDLLLLDEATSALDPQTEAAVGDAIRGLAGDRLIVSVTHRLNTVRDYDRIFVLRDGQLVEAGTHDALVAARGLYADMYERQGGVEVSGDGRMATVSAAWLATVPLLDHLDEAQREALVPRLLVERVNAGDVIVREGDAGDRLYLIARGEANVTVSTAGDAEQEVARLVDGDHFGELALLRNTPRQATVRARTPTLLCSLARAELDRLLLAAPGMRELLEAEARRREASADARAGRRAEAEVL